MASTLKLESMIYTDVVNIHGKFQRLSNSRKTIMDYGIMMQLQEKYTLRFWKPPLIMDFSFCLPDDKPFPACRCGDSRLAAKTNHDFFSKCGQCNQKWKGPLCFDCGFHCCSECRVNPFIFIFIYLF